MEIVIAISLGIFLALIGTICYVRITKDFNQGDKQ